MTHFAPALHAAAPRLLLFALAAFSALLVAQSSALAHGDIRPMIATGGAHSCALADNGTVKCWGQNSSGQLGDGTTAASAVPIKALRVKAANNAGPPKPAKLTRATTVVASASATCVLSDDSSIWCWGSNAYGELGIGSADAGAHPVPVQIPETKDFYLLAAGGNHFCAANWSAEVKCWGDNSNGQLGNGSVGGASATPGLVSGVKKLKSLTAGANFSCANLETTKVVCWGADDKGQLGAGPGIAPSGSPRDVPGLKDSYKLVAGASSVCSLGWSELPLRCWGDNSFGQLAQGTLGEATPRGVSDVTSLLGVKALGGSMNGACAVGNAVVAANNAKVIKDRLLQCWGDLAASGSPRVVSLADVADLSVGSSATSQCAIVRGGDSYCWDAVNPSPAAVGGLDLVTRPQYPNWAYLEPTTKLRLNKRGTAWRMRSRLTVEPSSFVFPKAACKGVVAADAFYLRRVKKKAKSANNIEYKRVGVRTKSRLRRSGDYCKANFVQMIPLSRFAGKKRRLMISATGFGNKVQSKFTTGSYELKKFKPKKQ